LWFLHKFSDREKIRYRTLLLRKDRERDAMVPQAHPRHIVRVIAAIGNGLMGDDKFFENLLWLLEQPGGLTCSHLRWIDPIRCFIAQPPPVGELAAVLPRKPGFSVWWIWNAVFVNRKHQNPGRSE